MKRMIRSNTNVQAATYVQRLIRKRPQKDNNGEPLVYSGSGGRSLVGINYDSIDKFSSKEAAEENLQKTAKNPKEWEVVEYNSVKPIEAATLYKGTTKNLQESFGKYIQDIAYELYEDLGDPGDQHEFVTTITQSDAVQKQRDLLVSAIQDAIESMI